MSNEAKNQMLRINGYEKIFEFVGKQTNKSQSLLKAIISIATENTDKTLDQTLEVICSIALLMYNTNWLIFIYNRMHKW